MNQATFNFAPKGKRADLAGKRRRRRRRCDRTRFAPQAPANDVDPGDAHRLRIRALRHGAAGALPVARPSDPRGLGARPPR